MIQTDEIIERSVLQSPLALQIHAGAIHDFRIGSQQHRLPVRRQPGQQSSQREMQPAGLLLFIQALAPGRVGHQQPLIGKIPGTQGPQFTALEVNRLTHPCPLRILLGQLDSAAIHIETLQGHFGKRLTDAIGRLRHCLLPELTTATPPLLKTVLFALGADSPASGDLRRFDEQGAGTTERIHQGRRMTAMTPA